MKKLVLFFVLLGCVNGFSQTLNLPARQTNALSGSQFEATIASSTLSLTNRENMIYAQVSAGNVPNFYRTLVAVTSTATISSVTQSVTYYVAPDYLAIGCDTDYFLMPMSPMLATKIGTLTGTTLPTRKMVGDIWAAATVKLAPQPLTAGPQMSTVPFFAHHDSIVGQQRATFSNPLGSLTSGDKKDVIISNMIYTTANRVIIFGWYYQNGTYIQPMTNVHADTYMDYSHGIRLVQNTCMLNGSTPTTIQAVLESSTLNPVLSDEGVISQPWYPYAVTLNTPKSFAVLKNSSTSLKLKVKNDPSATHYNVYTSTNGTTFNSPIQLPKNNLVLTGLTANQIYFVKISAYDSINAVTSAVSEVLAAVPTTHTDSTLLVNGFDRAITGNTYNFTIQHGTAFYNNNKYIESCTNEAITDNTVSLTNYRVVDWILGEESTADTTFSPHEQTYVSNYLKQGGYLFTSGSEIGWDLDHSGTTADKQFYNNYLKASYVADDPGGMSGTYYASFANTVATSIYRSNDTVNFDNGTHGTYNVNYPDVVATINGSSPDLHYATANTDYACLHYAGTFTGGTSIGKMVYMAYPFETIYPATMRDTVMKDILIFFFSNQNITTSVQALQNKNHTIYPNPTTGVFTIATNNLMENSFVQICDMQGRVLKEEAITETMQQINCNDFIAGIYFVKVFGNGGLQGTSQLIIYK
ncbi:MAG TPA: T9SS type A sorting domain-containing protein [Bacteroidia bacterium]|nr:T9SS type A sorting domain-containing protein [Bacteroidia bacterium]